MKYEAFKQYYHNSLESEMNGPMGEKMNYQTKLQFVIQGALDKTFNFYTQDPSESKPLPVWLLNMYNKFVRIIEDSADIASKQREALKLCQELFIEVFNNFGERAAKNLFVLHKKNWRNAA
ncbi:MAG: hypothetical protein R2772_03780 [Chitinophagales bacterium]|nr:hypothetical protein [Erysipelotrichaceae bacterium]